MKIVCFADVHANLFEEFADRSPKYGNTRLKDILHCLHRIHVYCVKHNINTILFAGDLFHKRVLVNTLVENLVYDQIKAMTDDRIFIYMIPGNHDQIDNSDFPQHSLHIFDSLKNVYIADTEKSLVPYTIPYNDEDSHKFVNIYPAPFSKNVQMIKDLITSYAEIARKHTDDAICDVLLGHAGIDGASTGRSSYPLEGAFSVDDLYPDVFDFGIFGHYHKRQHLNGLENYFYIGAPLQHNFNDEGQKKGFAVIDTVDKTTKFVNLKSPRFITITDPEISAEDLDAYKGDYVRFQIPADKVESINADIEQSGIKLKHRIEPQKEYEEEKRLDIDHSMSNEEIVKHYCAKFNPKATDTLLNILEQVG